MSTPGRTTFPTETEMPPIARLVRRLGHRYRARRFRLIRQAVDDIIAQKGFCTIIDIGGHHDFWLQDPDFVSSRKGKIKIVLSNIVSEFPEAEPVFQYVQADARNMVGFDDGAYDLCVSNSVIEHVGGWDDMAAMAKEVRRLAPYHIVQTPYFWFPVEPHFQAPLFHWLPTPLRLWIHMRFRLGFYDPAPSVEKAMEALEHNVLLSITQMQALFPESRIVRERALLVLTKSITAVHAPTPTA